MADKLITMPEAAVFVGLSYTYLRRLQQNHTEGFPLPKEKGARGVPLYSKADFLELKRKGLGTRSRALNNRLAVLFLTRQPLVMTEVGNE